MKYPTEKIGTITYKYFDCGHHSGMHRHKTKEAAINCMKRNKNNKPKRYIPLTIKKQFCIDILNGLTIKAASKKYGISTYHFDTLIWRIRYKLSDKDNKKYASIEK